MANCPGCLLLKELNLSLDNPSYCRACYQKEKAENKRLREDVEFLLPRCARANKCSLGEDERDTGSSSNSIVAIVYGIDVKQELPYDQYDLAACRRMWAKLPEHRKTRSAMDIMAKAEQALEQK